MAPRSRVPSSWRLASVALAAASLVSAAPADDTIEIVGDSGVRCVPPLCLLWRVAVCPDLQGRARASVLAPADSAEARGKGSAAEISARQRATRPTTRFITSAVPPSHAVDEPRRARTTTRSATPNRPVPQERCSLHAHSVAVAVQALSERDSSTSRASRGQPADPRLPFLVPLPALQCTAALPESEQPGLHRRQDGTQPGQCHRRPGRAPGVGRRVRLANQRVPADGHRHQLVLRRR